MSLSFLISSFFQFILFIDAKISGNHSSRCCVWLEGQLSGRSTCLLYAMPWAHPQHYKGLHSLYYFDLTPITSATSKSAYKRNACLPSLDTNGLTSQGPQDRAVSEGSVSDFCASGGYWQSRAFLSASISSVNCHGHSMSSSLPDVSVLVIIFTARKDTNSSN